MEIFVGRTMRVRVLSPSEPLRQGFARLRQNWSRLFESLAVTRSASVLHLATRDFLGEAKTGSMRPMLGATRETYE
jgi:hypothetical protein